LEDQYKIPFTRYYNGYKYEEIAKEMQLPLGTVKSRIFLARKILMESILKSQN
jgi:RNA polymerase sigma-70 factor (ECF subfamily)